MKAFVLSSLLFCLVLPVSVEARWIYVPQGEPLVLNCQDGVAGGIRRARREERGWTVVDREGRKVRLVEFGECLVEPNIILRPTAEDLEVGRIVQLLAIAPLSVMCYRPQNQSFQRSRQVTFFEGRGLEIEKTNGKILSRPNVSQCLVEPNYIVRPLFSVGVSRR